MTKSDTEIVVDIAARRRKSTAANSEPIIEPLAADEVEHSFVINGVTWTAWAQSGAGLELEYDARDYFGDFNGIASMDQSERDQLQAGIDATLMKLRAKLGKPVGVLGASVPPVWDDVDSFEHLE